MTFFSIERTFLRIYK